MSPNHPPEQVILTLSGNERLKMTLGQYQDLILASLNNLNKTDFIRRLWAKDASLWKEAPDLQKNIKNRLGWLTVTKAMSEHSQQIMEFADKVKKDGFTQALLLGMGGSSLCPEVCRLIFGHIPGYPDLSVLDSTDPATILSKGSVPDLEKTLFIVSTKSGTTTETLSFFKYFLERVRRIKGERAGENFVAITDPGTPLEKLAREQNFCQIFLNPPDIGGRYSALSYFGLVPAAVMGINIKTLLDRTELIVHSCDSNVPIEENTGVVLGAIMGELAREGRDKLSLLISPPLESFGYWVEQLVAESTGKEGKGLVPIEGEPLSHVNAYGADRQFVYLRLESAANGELDRQAGLLADAGHPIVIVSLRESIDIGQEFFRWELATAVAGSILGVNPFDEPNVQESKDNTNRLLAEFRTKGRLLVEVPVLEEEGLSFSCDGETLTALKKLKDRKEDTIASYLAAFLKQARIEDYLALLAYFERKQEHHKILQTIRQSWRDGLGVATTLGYGPRFLHSTGQLHKGGPNTGLFIQITADDPEDLPIPGEDYTFGILKRAQALGDFLSLRSKGRRIINLHLGKDIQRGLKRVLRAVQLGVTGLS